MKIIVIIMLILIFASLMSALYQLIFHRDSGTKMVKALTWRIGLSIFLFLLIIAGYFMGWFVPHAPF